VLCLISRKVRRAYDFATVVVDWIFAASNGTACREPNGIACDPPPLQAVSIATAALTHSAYETWFEILTMSCLFICSTLPLRCSANRGRHGLNT
jgi:hypothetical protein